jgi:predicted transcriptional regulator
MDDDVRVRRTLAKRHDLPDEVVRILIRDPDARVAANLVENFECRSLQDGNVSSSDQWFLDAAAVSPAFLNKLADADEPLAYRHPSLPKSQFAVGAASKNATIRESVALNPNVPQKILRRLELDGNRDVRRAATIALLKRQKPDATAAELSTCISMPCLECGTRHSALKNHLTAAHGLTAVQYIAKWGLRDDYPMTAPADPERWKKE